MREVMVRNPASILFLRLFAWTWQVKGERVNTCGLIFGTVFLIPALISRIPYRLDGVIAISFSGVLAVITSVAFGISSWLGFLGIWGGYVTIVGIVAIVVHRSSLFAETPEQEAVLQAERERIQSYVDYGPEKSGLLPRTLWILRALPIRFIWWIVERCLDLWWIVEPGYYGMKKNTCFWLKWK
jgi:hypothetical protein